MAPYRRRRPGDGGIPFVVSAPSARRLVESTARRIIGAGAVVTRDVEEYGVALGFRPVS